MVISLLEVTCRWCARQFCVCQSCWRGQAYCSESCRKEARRQSHSEAQRRYRSTWKGREAHRLSERRRRMGRVQKTMDDQSSIPGPADLIVVDKGAGCCRYCGRAGVIVDQFPRRGYGGGRQARRLGGRGDDRLVNGAKICTGIGGSAFIGPALS